MYFKSFDVESALQQEKLILGIILGGRKEHREVIFVLLYLAMVQHDNKNPEDYFYYQIHRVLYKAIQALKTRKCRDKPGSIFEDVIKILERDKKLDKAGGFEYVKSLSKSEDVDRHIELIEQYVKIEPLFYEIKKELCKQLPSLWKNHLMNK